MNRHHAEIQSSVARLGDHVAHVQMLLRGLAECRRLTDEQLDPESELAVVCWLAQAAEILRSSPGCVRETERPLS